MNKLLAVLLAGAVFAGGMIAPDEWRDALQGQVAKITGQSEPAVGGADAAKGDKDKTPPFSFAEVQRPLRLAEGDKLGLSLGLFTGETGGAKVEQLVKALGYSAQYLAVEDGHGVVWKMLIAGEYDKTADAKKHLAILSNSLRGQSSPEIVRIPPPPK